MKLLLSFIIAIGLFLIVLAFVALVAFTKGVAIILVLFAVLWLGAYHLYVKD